jgi:hypothetical protein
VAKASRAGIRGLTPVDKFYVEHHRHLPVEELAKHVGKTAKAVQAFIAELPPIKVEDPPKKKRVSEGHAILDADKSSEMDDLHTRKSSSFEEYAKKHPDRFHIPNP